MDPRMICLGKSGGTRVEVSLADIIQRPESFDGKHLRVAGFITFLFEGMSIYPDDRVCTDEGLWLAVETFPGGSQALFKGLRDAGKGLRGHGFVEGILNRQCRGHFGLWPAVIDPLTLVAVARSNAEWRDYDWAVADEALRNTRRARISELRRLATDILSGNLCVIEGSQCIYELRGYVDIDFNAAEYRAFHNLVQATLHLPFGPVRQYWATDALREKDAEIHETEERWAEPIRGACRVLLERFKLPNP
jgi:hypothetical protein